MKTKSDKAIILRRIEYGEADRIITFLTESAGKIRGILKGVRRQKSKMAGGVELFSISEIHYIQGRGDIHTITSTRLINHFGNIVKDIDRTEIAYQAIKQIDELVEDANGQEYFAILSETLAGLDNKKIDINLVKINFDIRILQTYGNLPDFSHDKHGQLLEHDKNFSFDQDSLSFFVDAGGKFNKNHIKFLKLLAHNSPQSVVLVEDATRYCTEVREIVSLISRQTS